jgi:LPXTG-motif cell wall-anchored protein
MQGAARGRKKKGAFSMKKAMKKLMAALLAVAMVCAMAIPAFAAGTGSNTLTINGKTAGHTYEAYQVFTGDLKGKVLSNIDWGNGVIGDDIRNDPDLPSSLKGLSSAAALAAELAKLSPSSDDVNTFAEVVSKHLTANKYTSTEAGMTYTINNLPDGYYFIKDATASASMPAGATYSRYMLNIVQSLTIEAKDTTVTLDKQIRHNETGDWGVVGDNQIGDTVEFRTITTVPDTTGYTDYTYEIHDTMSPELTSKVKTDSDITIKVNDTTVLNSTYYSVTVDSTNSNKFTVSVDIIQAIKDNKFAVGNTLYTYYDGVLNENAKVYPDGPQQNEAHLVYSNNPNDVGTGETPKKTVYDWTFKVDVTKVDGNDKTQRLEGAVFVLSEKSGLDLEPGKDGTPTKNQTSLIKLVDNHDGTYTVADTTTTTTYTMTTPAGGQISIKGLDDEKEYYLYETKAPGGYNALTAPVKIKITNNTYDSIGNQIVTQPNVVFNEVNAYSGVGFDVENNVGTTLPGTGGIGTTIFYVIGGGLMVAAAILLITKKRMENH